MSDAKLTDAMLSDAMLTDAADADASLAVGPGFELPEVQCEPPGPESKKMIGRLAAIESPALYVHRDIPIVLSRGLGSNVWDVDGNRYVDLAAGFGSLLLGHGSEQVRQAMQTQSASLIQGLGDFLPTDAKLPLLERLQKLHPDGKAQIILAQSGGDAVAAAIKTAVLATGRPGLVAFQGAYHGLGYGPLAVCGLRPSYRMPFRKQLNPHVEFVHFPSKPQELDASLAQLATALQRSSPAAVVVEPIMGRGGVILPPAGFLEGLVDLAHRAGALVIADEIWTGIGRSGSMVCSTAMGARADILCFGKGLGGGLSISACVASHGLLDVWAGADEVAHTSTHSGAPLACRTAAATLAAIESGRLDRRATRLGEQALKALGEGLLAHRDVVAVRGRGLMLAVQFTTPQIASAVLTRWLSDGYLAIAGGADRESITMTPPLTISSSQLFGAIESLTAIVTSS